MPIVSQAQNRALHAKASRGDKGAQKMLDHSLAEMRGGKKASRYQKEHPIKAANLPERVHKGLTPQPRFSGNGGHGKRIVDLEEFDKAFLPSVGDKGLRGIASSLGRSYKAGVKNPTNTTFTPKSTASQWAFRTGQFRANPREQLYAHRKPLAIGALAGGTAVGGTALLNKALMPVKTKPVTPSVKNPAKSSSVMPIAKPQTTPSNRRTSTSSLFGKRARTYDAELNRQRRQGMYTAGGAAGAAGLAGWGVRDTREARQAGRRVAESLADLQGERTVIGRAPENWSSRVYQLAGGKGPRRDSSGKTTGSTQAAQDMRPLSSAQRKALEEARHLRGSYSRRAGGKFGAAAVLGAGSLGMYRHSRSEANRRWN